MATYKPVQVYHGTTRKFKEFDLIHLGGATRSRSARFGFWFTDDIETAKSYAREENNAKVNELIRTGKVEEASRLEDKIFNNTDTKYLKTISISYNNPLIIDADGRQYNDYSEEIIDAIKQAVDNKNDVLIVKNLSDHADYSEYRPSTHYLVLDNTIIEQSKPDLKFEIGGVYQEHDSRYADGGLIAPNGKKSNLSPEQYKLVRTPEFKAWFGDWENDAENSSQVIDSNGEPLLVWHGSKSNENFNVFKQSSRFEFIYFAKTKQYAWFHFTKDIIDKPFQLRPFFLNIRNLLNAEEYGFEKVDFSELKSFFYGIHELSKDIQLNPKSQYKFWEVLRFSNDIYHSLKNQDYYDGISFYENFYDNTTWNDTDDYSLSYVVMNPNQIKLADGSNTTFNANNPDIRYADGGGVGNMKKLYRGTNTQEHDSRRFTWFSEDKDFAKGFGDILIEKEINVGKVFDSTNQRQIQLLIDNGFQLYNEYDDTYFKTAEEASHYSDTWDFIENSYGVLDWIDSKGYDSVKILEGGSNVNYILIDNNQYADGGEVAENKETYKKWKSLVNMSKGELEKFYNSQEGKDAGLSSQEASEQGISSGRESARWIMKMKDTNVSDWTPSMWRWAKKQISFISRMSGNKGSLYDDKGDKTRKHTSLLIWGHNPKKNKFDLGGLLLAPQKMPTFIAPNGKPSNLTPEQYRLVRTSAFKKWFGDWENYPESASKVVDENGEPLQVYHKTDYKFTVFDKEKLGSTSNWGTAYFGFYFSNKYERVSYGKRAVKCFLNIRNPYLIESETYYDYDYEYKRFDISNFSKNDGILIKTIRLVGNEKADKHFVAFKPTQIKLADGSNTTFDGSNPDIRFDNGGEIDKVIWHGSDYEINKFDYNKIINRSESHITNMWGFGIYFTNNKNQAKEYGKHLYSVVLSDDVDILKGKVKQTQLNKIWDGLIREERIEKNDYEKEKKWFLNHKYSKWDISNDANEFHSFLINGGRIKYKLKGSKDVSDFLIRCGIDGISFNNGIYVIFNDEILDKFKQHYSNGGDIRYAEGGGVKYLKGNKLKIFKILQNNYLTKEEAEESKENYSQLNIWEEGERVDSVDVKAFDNENYFDFDMFEKQISEILKNKLVDKIELEYGDYEGANTEWFTLYELKGKYADGGDVNAMNVEVKLVKDNDLSDKVLDLVLNTDELGAVGQPRLALLENGNVIGGIFLEPPNSYSLNGKYVVETYWEYKFDIIIERSKRKKGYSKLLLDAMIKDFVDNFPDADQIRGEVINKKLEKSLKKYYGFSCDSGNEENITYCHLSKDDAVKFKYADGGQTPPYVSDDFQIGYDGAYEHLIAPNGKPTNLTPEQYRLVRTPAFKAWFGDWENDAENSSKVVDENGEPLVVYHGAKIDFNEFIGGKLGVRKDNSQGFYFTPFKNIAVNFATNGFVKEVFLKIFNLKIAKSYLEIGTINKDYVTNAIDKGYDGAYFMPNKEKNGYYSYYNEEYVAFYPKQIKLADGTNTTFDSNNADIRYKNGGKVEPMSFPTFVDLDNSFPIDKGYRWADWQDIRTPTEMNKVFKHYNIPLKAKKNLGKGLFGYAFLTDKDTVVKITNNSNEAFASFVIMQKGNLLTTQAKVFKMYKITNGSRSLYIIEKEYIPQVLENSKEFNEYFKDILQYAKIQSNNSDSVLHQKAREYYTDGLLENDDELNLEDKDMIDKTYKILKFYKEIENDETIANLSFDDIHTGNIGFKDDKLLCFDCAMTGNTELKSGGMVN